MADTNRAITVEYLGDHLYRFTANSPDGPEPFEQAAISIPYQHLQWLFSGYYDGLSTDFSGDIPKAVDTQATKPEVEKPLETKLVIPADTQNDNRVETSGNDNLQASISEALKQIRNEPTKSK
jgi:hypothetical protein